MNTLKADLRYYGANGAVQPTKRNKEITIRGYNWTSSGLEEEKDGKCMDPTVSNVFHLLPS